MLKTKRERNLVIIATIFGVTILLWSFMNPPGKSAPKVAIISLEEANAKKKTALKSLASISQDQDKLTPKITAMAYDLPPDQLEPRIVRNIQDIALKANVHIREIKPIKARKLADGNGSKVSMEVRFRAAFQPNVMKFLYLAEDPTGKLVVDKLSLISADARFRTVEVSAQIAVFTRSTAVSSGI